MENNTDKAMKIVQNNLQRLYPDIDFHHQSRLTKQEIVDLLRSNFPQHRDKFQDPENKRSFIKPDGGFLFAEIGGKKRLILVSEAKRQGTNDEREKEGKSKQSQGNAVERLGKNLTEVRSIFAAHDITPFVCFGEGVDFSDGSSILDRVLTMNQNMPLNQTHVYRVPPFQPVSLYFRRRKWGVQPMADVMTDVASQSIEYYLGLLNEPK